MTVAVIPRQRQADQAGTPKALYRVTEAMATLSLSRTAIYEEMRAGRLRYVTPQGSRRIPAAAIEEYVALLEAESVKRAG